MQDAHAWIERLRLAPHPEGGHYRETYRATGTVATPHGPRSHSTAIYYLLCRGEVSTLHRLRSDELFHYYAGAALVVHVIDAAGRYAAHRVGPDPARGESLQLVVPAGDWFGATVDDGGAYALVGCTVAPGFDFADFEQARRATLVALYPRHREIIERLTR